MESLTTHTNHLVYVLRRLHWQSKLGLLFFAAGLSLLFILIPAETNHLDTLTKDYSNITQKKAMKPVEKVPVFSVDEQFYAVLPAQNQVNVKIAQILEKANDSGLLIEKADYAALTASDALLHKYQIRLPVNGSYTQIRTFINQILNTQSNLALSEVNFRRDDIGTDIVSANILFTLYLK